MWLLVGYLQKRGGHGEFEVVRQCSQELYQQTAKGPLMLEIPNVSASCLTSSKCLIQTLKFRIKGHSRPNMALHYFVELCMLISVVL